MKVVAYARVSTELQREKETIKTQIESIREFCKRENHLLVDSFHDDGITGTTYLSERPQGKRLMEAARRGEFEAVVVYKSDRFGRDTLVNETIAKELYDDLGVQLIGVAETIDLKTSMGRTMFTLNSALARMERENTLQRSRDATRRLAKDGVWLGGICPFGYEIEGKDREARLKILNRLIPDIEKSEADIIRMIYDWSAKEGLSCTQIAERLNVMGVPTSYTRDGREVERNKRKQKTRGVWRSGRVRNMIVETTYKGIHQWGKRGSKQRPKNKPKEIIEREVPPIVDEATWERAQETLKKNRMLRPDVTRRRYLLRGLMKCAHCGFSYCGTSHKGRLVTTLTPDELDNAEIRDGRALKPYYFCNGTITPNQIFGEPKRCSATSLNALEIESIVWSDLERFLRNPGAIIEQLRSVLENQQIDTNGLKSAMSRFTSDLNSIEEARHNILRLYRRNQISESSLNFQLKEVDSEELLLKAEIQRIQSELLKAQNANDSLLSVENTLLKLRLNLDAGISWEVKREIVESLVEGIKVETIETERGRKAHVRVKYRFEMPNLVPENALVSIGTDVRAVFFWAECKRTQTDEDAPPPAPAPRRKLDDTSPRYPARCSTGSTSTSKCPDSLRKN